MVGWKRYLRLERSLSANTVAAYMSDVEEFVEWLDGAKRPEEVAREDIEGYMVSLYERRAAKTTQSRTLSSLRSLYRYLAITGATENSPTEFVASPKSGRHLPDVLTVGEIDRALDTIDLSSPSGVRDRAMLEMLYSCGLRVSELTALRFTDLFIDDGVIRVTGKGSRERLVPISGEAAERLRFWLECRPKAADAKNADYIFLNLRGRRISRVAVFGTVKKAVAAAGIDKSVSPHTLRHSFATHLLEGGAGIRQVQELLGHQSVTTTEIYTHLDRRHLAEAIEKYLPHAEK